MRYLFLSFGLVVGVYLMSRSRSDMQKIKPKKAECMTPEWMKWHIYCLGQEGDEA